MSAQGWQRPRSGKKGKDQASLISIADVVRHYGGEVREGKASAVRCVMHDDRMKSAVINTYDNLYFCHTEGKGGNAVSVVMIMENLEFKDALKRALEITASGGQQVRGSSGRSHTKVSRRSWNI